MLKESELEMLKSQINPHFIFNSLNSISSLTITAPDRARSMVIKLSDFLRYSLDKENHQLNSLEDELKNLLLYLDIEKVRFGDRLKVETDVPEEAMTCTLPNLILQPLFENAVKHGIYESLEQVTIKLNASLEGTILRITVSNEFDPNAVSRKGKGIGLKNVTQRLNVIYGVPKLVFTEKSDQIFTVRLDIPQPNTES
jgi:LytS/YehU family sensor histidine kinase